jgi:Protein of unknown function (DUF3048) N-terminal domain/Protein of unknown function (DUF3048) C-terminal domain
MHDTDTTGPGQSFWQRFKGWAHHHHTLVYMYVGIGIIIAASLIAFSVLTQKPQKVNLALPVAAKKKPVPPPPVFYSPLTGGVVADEAATKMPVTAIMIENSPDARPQSGLKSAGFIFEAIAEGGITRFLALYQQEKPQLIGPVRSVRLYYVQWLAPFNASVAHVGGSLFALQEVRSGKYRDIDQFFNGSSYWRATDRYAPHNVYTNFAKLDALNAAKGFTTSTPIGFSRKDPAPSKTPNATKIAVTISGPLYNSSYTYDAASNKYFRSEGGAPHNDRELGQLSPTSVVVMNVDMKLILEDGWREQITTTGSGKATIFQDGTVTVGTWTKKDVNSQITFATPDGKDIPLDRGQTWITAIPNGSGNVTWQ